MTKQFLLAPLLLGSAMSLSACAQNYAVEGAALGAAAGAAAGVIADGNVGRAAAVGAAAGAVGGALVEKDGRCYRRDDRGREYEVRCRR